MKNILRQFAATLALCTLAGASGAATQADVQIINRSTGEALPIYRHQGQLWVAGKPGDRYSIQVNNRTGGRLLAVVAVDGVNVISGETAATSQRGYVLAPRNSVDVAGWRKSDRDVAAFYFTALPDAYASRTQRPDNIGVIGIAAFREYQAPVVIQEQAADSASIEQRARLATAAAAPLARAEKSLGTGHGERVYAPTHTVDFQRAGETPDEIITIRYDAYANLITRGIIPSPRPRTPNAFPGGNYVPDPS